MNFENLVSDQDLLDAVEELGFDSPTPIQLKAIPEILNTSEDIIALAQTGTGKTAAFGLPISSLVDFSSKRTQALVLCPTRELCIQISRDFKSFCRFKSKAKIVSVYGGTSISRQITSIKKGAQIIVATPGRLHDLLRRKVVNFEALEYLVLDEADEMMSMGFKEDIDFILDSTPENRRTFLFSATMPKTVVSITKDYMSDPVEIVAGKKNSLASNIEHLCYMVKEKHRYEALKRVIDSYPDIYGLVFCKTRKETGEVADKLIKDGYNAEALHGDLSQAQRDSVMKRFRRRQLDFIVATDVAARGIDIDDITHVINYNLPDDVEVYTHRSGRTARAGKEGISAVIISPMEQRRLKAVEFKTKVKFTFANVPDGNLICERQLLSFVDRFSMVDVDEAEIEKFIEPVYEKLKDLSREEIIKMFISMEFNRFLDYYRNSGDITLQERKPKKNDYDRGRKKTMSRYSSGKTSRLFISAGSMDNLNKGGIIRLVCDKSGIKSHHIKKIDIKREFSFFDVESDYAEHVISTMKNLKYDGRKISVAFSKKRK